MNNAHCNKEWPSPAITGIQQKRVKPDPDSHHAGASLSFLLVWEMLHTSHLLFLWLISEWKKVSKVLYLGKPKREISVKATLTPDCYLEGSFDSLTPLPDCHFLPADSREVCSRSRGLTSQSVWESCLLPSWNCSPEKQNHDKKQQCGLTPGFNGQIRMSKGKMKDSK